MCKGKEGFPKRIGKRKIARKGSVEVHGVPGIL
jgi:hypothetical protein